MNNELKSSKVISVNKKINNRDSTLLLFMFIKDAINLIPRPKGIQGKFSKNETANVEQNFSSCDSSISNSKNSQLDNKINCSDQIIDQLISYEAAIQKIERISNLALAKVDGIKVGGRNIKLTVKAIAIQLAIEYKVATGKFPPANRLCEMVREASFKESPVKYIELVDKKFPTTKHDAHQRSNPTWRYWRTFEVLTSERALSGLLKKLKETSTKK
jgi:hypothetical protein